jgi:hypothetical protein
MKNLPSLLVALAVCLAAPASAQDAAPAEGEVKVVTLQKLVAVRNLRCDALQRGKQATTSANIHRSQQGHARGVLQLNAEAEIKRFEGEASAAFEEAGAMKRRLTRMSEEFLTQQRAAWYATVDIAQRIRIEKMILGAKEIIDEPCG